MNGNAVNANANCNAYTKDAPARQGEPFTPFTPASASASATYSANYSAYNGDFTSTPDQPYFSLNPPSK